MNQILLNNKWIFCEDNKISDNIFLIYQKNDQSNKFVLKRISVSYWNTQRISISSFICQLMELIALNHLSIQYEKGVPQIQDLWIDKQEINIVFKYYENKCLSTYLNQKKKFSKRLMNCFIVQMLKILKISHSLNIAHLDIKPQNILIKNSSSQDFHIFIVKSEDEIEFQLSDWGSAQIIRQNTNDNFQFIEMSNLKFSPLYEPLEHIKQQKEFYDKMDLYQLGLTLLNCAGFTIPECQNGNIDQFKTNIDKAIKDFNIKETYGEEVEKLIEELIQIDPEKRPSALECLNQFQPENNQKKKEVQSILQHNSNLYAEVSKSKY